MQLTSEEWSALRLSFQVGLSAVLASLPIAIVVGYLLARWNSRGRWLLEMVVNLPLVLPPVVTGYLLLVMFAPRGPLGAGRLRVGLRAQPRRIRRDHDGGGKYRRRNANRRPGDLQRLESARRGDASRAVGRDLDL